MTKLVTPQYAAKWRLIGSLLGLSSSELEIIEHDRGHNAVNCCSEMWGKWLDKDISASWNDVLNILEHKTVMQAKMIIPTDNEAKGTYSYIIYGATYQGCETYSISYKSDTVTHALP